jgi:H+/Na+-translocating ferredoxin:NAD+ oxidoreductase subunit G
MKDFIRMVAALGIITALAGLGLGTVYDMTDAKIKQQEKAAQLAALQSALPGYEIVSEKLEAGGVPYWKAEKNGQTAYGLVASKMGYQSLLKVMVGIDEDGSIVGLSVISQAETPGLGARLTELNNTTTLWQALTGKAAATEEKSAPWFAMQFTGLKATEPMEVEKGPEWKRMDEDAREALRSRNNISSLSGATISSRCIVDAVDVATHNLLQALAEESK